MTLSFNTRWYCILPNLESLSIPYHEKWLLWKMGWMQIFAQCQFMLLCSNIVSLKSDHRCTWSLFKCFPLIRMQHLFIKFWNWGFQLKLASLSMLCFKEDINIFWTGKQLYYRILCNFTLIMAHNGGRYFLK